MILGIDEAGRGPLIGPLVIAGVLIDEKSVDRLGKVKDSKQLKPAKREQFYEKIVVSAQAYEIIIIPPEEIDAALMNPNTNLNWLEADKMAELINLLKPDKVYADCPSTNIRAFTEYLRRKVGDKVELILEHKADEKYPVVSAASILAKVTRDRSVETLRGVYGDFGSGYLTDPKTQLFIENDISLPIFRRSWVTWKRKMNAKSQKTLGDY